MDQLNVANARCVANWNNLAGRIYKGLAAETFAFIALTEDNSGKRR